MIIPGIGTITRQIDRETTLSNHTEITLKKQIHNKTTEVEHPSIKDKLTKYNQHKKLNQTQPVLTI